MAIVDYPQAQAAFVNESRVFIDQNDHKAIVLHCTASANPNQSSQQLGAYFAVTPLLTSVHFGIDRRGVISQYCLLKDGSGGNGLLEAGHDAFWDTFNGDNLNWHTISIECVNDVNNSLPLSAAQQAALFPLVAWLCKRYSIPYDHIKSHASLDPSTRSHCPGEAFPWDALKTYIEEVASMAIPKGWHDDGTTLTAPNGVQVRQGFRSHILNDATWNPDDYPIEVEHGQSPLEESNPALGAGSQQTFRLSMLGFTPARGVFKEWLGVELLKLRTELHK